MNRQPGIAEIGPLTKGKNPRPAEWMEGVGPLPCAWIVLPLDATADGLAAPRVTVVPDQATPRRRCERLDLNWGIGFLRRRRPGVAAEPRPSRGSVRPFIDLA